MNSLSILGCLFVISSFTSCKKDASTSVESSWNEIAEAKLKEQSMTTTPSLNLIAEDSFDISDSDYLAKKALLGQKPITYGFQGEWIAHTPVNARVSPQGLEYLNLKCSGGKIGIPKNHNGSIGRRLNSSYTDTSTGIVYISFLLNIKEIGTADAYNAFELQDSTLGNIKNGLNHDKSRQFALGTCKDDFGTLGFGFRPSNDIAFSRELSDARNLDVNLFVLKFNLSDKPHSDSVTVWMNPTLGEAPDSGVSVSGFDISFDTIALTQFRSSIVNIDEIRIGKSFATVTPKQ